MYITAVAFPTASFKSKQRNIDFNALESWWISSTKGLSKKSLGIAHTHTDTWVRERPKNNLDKSVGYFSLQLRKRKLLEPLQ